MKEQLLIRSFGPVHEASIELSDLTVFVGPQATGKSLAAQALYFLRGIEDLLVSVPTSVETPAAIALSALEWWLGNAPSVYADPGTVLCWSSAKLFKGSKQEIRWTQEGVRLSGALKKRITTSQRKERGDSPKTQVYIPAGRTLYSFLTPSSALRFVSRARPEQQWPGYIITFYETLGKALERLAREGIQVNQFSDVDSLLRLKQQIQSIFKGRIQYGPDTIVLETEKAHLRPVNIAAGQMEIWPFWAVVEAGLQSGTLVALDVYFEEPEAHLHPGAQRSVMEMVAFLVRRGVRVLLITHSPYILYAINNFLMAQKVLDEGLALPAEVPLETALRPDQVAAYRFDASGKVHNIMDSEVGLIDEDELDQAADDLGATFTQLQERLEGIA